MERGDNRRKLGGQTDGFAKVGGGLVALEVGINAAEGAGGGAKGVHRFGRRREGFKHRKRVIRKRGVGRKLGFEPGQFGAIGSLDSQRRKAVSSKVAFSTRSPMS